MIINVTQDHIDSGFKKNACHCPIALACRAALGVYTTVSKEKIIFRAKDDIFEKMRTPKAAAEFIDKFDNDLPVLPFTFEIPCQPSMSLTTTSTPASVDHPGNVQ